MLEDTIMPLHFFEGGGVFTGQTDNMHYMIKRIQKKSDDDDNKLIAYIWTGPYRFDVVKDELKEQASFECSQEGRACLIKWLRDKYESGKTEYKKRVSLTGSQETDSALTISDEW